MTTRVKSALAHLEHSFSVTVDTSGGFVQPAQVGGRPALELQTKLGKAGDS